MRPNRKSGEHGTENASSCSGPNLSPSRARMTPAERRELRRLASLGEDATEEEFGVLSHALIPLLDALDEAERSWKYCALELDGYESGAPAKGTRYWRCEKELVKAREARDVALERVKRLENALRSALELYELGLEAAQAPDWSTRERSAIDKADAITDAAQAALAETEKKA